MGIEYKNDTLCLDKLDIGVQYEMIEDPENRSEITLDSDGKIISYRDADGVKHEEVCIKSTVVNTNSLNLTEQGMTEFQQALKDAGFNPGGTGDWTDYLSKDGDYPLVIPQPRCAMLNVITTANLTTLSKVSRPEGFPGVNCELPTQVEFWDMQGNYFKKWTLMSAQGNSSMGFAKRNLAFDFFDSEVDGDVFSVKFGDWVPQDSFHLKAYYTDFFRGSSVIAYHIVDDIENSKGIIRNRTWKKALIDGNAGNSSYNANLGKKMNMRVDTGARCMPDGFPVAVYRNGEFYGIFSWQIKKHRDNYHMDKKSAKQIHIDGDGINNAAVFGGHLDWTQFEVRNPKNLVYKSASLFDEYDEAETYIQGAIVRNANSTALFKSRRGGNVGHSLDNEEWWYEISDTCYKYDADIAQAEIAGNADGSKNYPTWEAGSYAIDTIVKHVVTIDGETEEQLFLNTVSGNTKEPSVKYDEKKDKWYNSAEEPDFKNKTKCGWLNVTTSVKVKENLISLSTHIADIDAAATDSEKKTLFDKYFDAENLYEYQIVQCLTGDYDGNWGKNWQWTTWDGKKWFVNNYDKDCTFGNDSWGGWIYPPFLTLGYPLLSGWNASTGPQKYMNGTSFGIDYAQVKKDRYKELREKGIISVDNIVSKMVDWVSRIGEKTFELEYAKWDNCPCNKDAVINAPWEVYEVFSYEEYIACPIYSDNTVYQAGDTCRLSGRMTYKIPDDYVGTVTGVTPLAIEGHRDNIFRFENWIRDRISLLDEYCGYSDEY